jgi:hypothetical protein
VGAERRQPGGLVGGGAERGGQVLVDVGVDGQHGQPAADEVPDEQGGQRGLAAAALADEGDLHCRALQEKVMTSMFRSGNHSGTAAGSFGDPRGAATKRFNGPKNRRPVVPSD